MYRVVLDTNVLINGVQDEESYTKKIIDACIANKIEPVISSAIRRENEKMASKLIKDTEYFEVLDEYYKAATEIEPTKKIKIVEEDPDDNKFIEAAVASDADFIVTEDNHLLDLDEYEGIRSITPSQLWNMYAEDSEEDNPWNVWADGMQDDN